MADDPRVVSFLAMAEREKAMGRVSVALQLETQAGIIRNALAEIERVKAACKAGACPIEHAFKNRHHVEALRAEINEAAARVTVILATPRETPDNGMTAARIAAHQKLYGG